MKPERTYNAMPDFWNRSVCQFCRTPLETAWRGSYTNTYLRQEG
jgi:hypothetical protein